MKSHSEFIRLFEAVHETAGVAMATALAGGIKPSIEIKLGSKAPLPPTPTVKASGDPRKRAKRKAQRKARRISRIHR